MFSKKIWNDRRVQYPNRRQLVRTATNDIVDLQRAEGNVYVIGDKFDADTMNNLEDRINNAFNTYNNKRKPIMISNKTLYGGSSWQTVPKQNWDSKSEYLFRQKVNVSGMTSSDKVIDYIIPTEFEEKLGMIETTNGGFYVYAKERIASSITIIEVCYLKG